MKTKYILLLILNIITLTNFAQKSKPINSGFVFIDGKYIEPPYVVKRKGNKIFINNNLVASYDKKNEKNPLDKYKKRLPPPICLNKNSSLKDFNNCREPKYNLKYYDYMLMYYIKNYPYQDAKDSIVAYIKTYPNVKNVNFSGSVADISFYNGENLSILLAYSSTALLSKKWGPNGVKTKFDKKLAKEYTIDNLESITENLIGNNIVISELTRRGLSFTIVYKEDLFKFNRILKSNYSN